MPWNTAPDDLEPAPRPLVAMARDLRPGETIAPHSHRRVQFIHASAGVMRVTAADGTWLVPPQRALWMPAGIEHRIDCLGAVNMRTLYLRADALLDPATPRRVVATTPLVDALIARAVDLPVAYDEAGPDGRLVAVLLDQLGELDETPLHLPMPRDPRARRAAERILRAPGLAVSGDSLARDAGASSRTLARLFAAETGLNIGAWRQQARLLAAVGLLGAGRGVSATAYELGYDSPSAFVAMFRRAFGTTPGRYFAT